MPVVSNENVAAEPVFGTLWPTRISPALTPWSGL
jgi:hypothetical protein